MTLNSLARRLADLEKVVHQLRSTPGEKHVAGASPQRASGDEQAAARGRVPLQPQIPPPPSQQEKPAKPWHKTLQGWKTMLEIIGIPFAIAYATVTCLQWRDLQRNFATEQRAWLTIQNGDLNIKGKVGEPLATDLMVTNTGRTPAERITGNIILTVLSPNETIDTSYGEGHIQSRATSGTVLPNNPQKFRVTGVVKPENGPTGGLLINEEMGQNLNAGLLRIVLYGRLDYYDVNGKPHWITFCNHMSGNAMTRVPGCAEYNAIDHNR